MLPCGPSVCLTLYQQYILSSHYLLTHSAQSEAVILVEIVFSSITEEKKNTSTRMTASSKGITVNGTYMQPTFFLCKKVQIERNIIYGKRNGKKSKSKFVSVNKFSPCVPMLFLIRKYLKTLVRIMPPQISLCIIVKTQNSN